MGDLAIIYTMVGEYDLALDLIEELFNIPSWFSESWIDLDIRLSPLTSLPRYNEMIEKYTLKE